MPLSEDTDKQINEHLKRLNEDAKAPLWKKVSTFLTALSVITAIVSLYNWKDKGDELRDAENKLEVIQRQADIQEKIAEIRLSNLNDRKNDLERENDLAASQLQIAQEQNLQLVNQIDTMLSRTIELSKLIGDKEDDVKNLEEQQQGLIDAANSYKTHMENAQATKETLDGEIRELNTRIGLFEDKLDVYAEHIDEDGYYTVKALRDLIAIRYIKTPISRLWGNEDINIPFTRPYKISLFLTYPKFAQDQLDKQIISVTYPLDNDVRLKGNEPLIIKENVSEGGLRFLGSYSGYGVPTNLTAVIKFATLTGEDVVELDMCTEKDGMKLCEDSITLSMRVD